MKVLAGLLDKLADKALAALPGIIESIVSWVLNRAKEVVGWLSQNIWALITGVGVLVYTYFMTSDRYQEKNKCFQRVLCDPISKWGEEFL